jgi:hypothetical protein
MINLSPVGTTTEFRNRNPWNRRLEQHRYTDLLHVLRRGTHTYIHTYIHKNPSAGVSLRHLIICHDKNTVQTTALCVCVWISDEGFFKHDTQAILHLTPHSPQKSARCTKKLYECVSKSFRTESIMK